MGWLLQFLVQDAKAELQTALNSWARLVQVPWTKLTPTPAPSLDF